MKSKEFKALKNKQKTELVKMVNDKKLELTKITGRIYAGKEKNLKVGRNMRRDIAQLMSTLSQVKEEVKKS